MDLCDFTKDKSPILAPHRKTTSTSTSLTTLPEVYSFTLHSSKHPQKNNPKLQSAPIKQPRPLNPLEPNHPLLHGNTPATALTNTYVFIHFPHHIFEDNCGDTGHHSTKIKIDDYSHHFLKTLHIMHCTFPPVYIFFDSTFFTLHICSYDIGPQKNLLF